jgi:hypothetical protein
MATLPAAASSGNACALAAGGLEITQYKQLCIIQGCGSDTNHISSPFPHQTHTGPRTPFAVILDLSNPLARPQPQRVAARNTLNSPLQASSGICKSHPGPNLLSPPPLSPPNRPPPHTHTLHAHTAYSHGSGWLCSSQACFPCKLSQAWACAGVGQHTDLRLG